MCFKINSVNMVPSYAGLFHTRFNTNGLFPPDFQVWGRVCIFLHFQPIHKLIPYPPFHFTTGKINFLNSLNCIIPHFTTFSHPYLTSSLFGPDILFTTFSEPFPIYVIPLMCENSFDLCHG